MPMFLSSKFKEGDWVVRKKTHLPWGRVVTSLTRNPGRVYIEWPAKRAWEDEKDLRKGKHP